MEDSKEGVLPLVGKVIKQRLAEVTREAKQQLGEGLDELADELRNDVEGHTDATADVDDAAPHARIEVEDA
jgi:hypothetical protein